MRKEIYKQYSVEDWVQDEPFKDYILHNNPTHAHFWAAIRSEDKKTAERMNEATVILSAMAGLFREQREEGENKAASSFSELDKSIKANHAGSKRKILLMLSAAASVAIVAIAIWVIMGSTKPTTYITSANETEEVNLPDGSIVYLNENSSLSINHTWKRGIREVLLNGEAYFMVHSLKNPVGVKSKFTVKTNGLNIEVLGTQFNVRTLDTITKIALDEGSIKLISISGDNKESLMAPGEIASFNQQSNDLKISKKPLTNPEIYWKPKTIEFNQVKLSDAIEKMGTVFGIAFNTENNDLLNLHIDKLSVPSDNPDVFIETVNILFADKIIIKYDPKREIYTIQKINRSID